MARLVPNCHLLGRPSKFVAMTSMPQLHAPSRPLRVVTAAALFDGHDAAINIMRRILQAQGAEVIHLGHNRSVDEVADGRDPGGRRRDRGQLVPGRPRRVLRVPRSNAERARLLGTSASMAVVAARSLPEEIERLARESACGSSALRTGSTWAWRRWSTRSSPRAMYRAASGRVRSRNWPAVIPTLLAQVISDLEFGVVP